MATLQELTAALEALAPRRLAQDWDNVGLLIEPARTRPVTRVGLAIDLTEPVYDELVTERRCDALVAYHPPIFAGLKRLRRSDALQRTLLRAIEAGVAIHSPHTALDAAPGGMADWLLEGLGAATEIAAIEPAAGEAEPAGAGRLGRLDEALLLGEVVARLKKHLGLAHVRVAKPDDKARRLRRVAVCPGAGGSLFQGLRDVDLLVTGEMGHHDVLRQVGMGRTVVLTDHSNTERGFLPVFAERLRAALPGLQTAVSAVDSDPLTVL